MDNHGSVSLFEQTKQFSYCDFGKWHSQEDSKNFCLDSSSETRIYKKLSFLEFDNLFSLPQNEIKIPSNQRNSNRIYELNPKNE